MDTRLRGYDRFFVVYCFGAIDMAMKIFCPIACAPGYMGDIVLRLKMIVHLIPTSPALPLRALIKKVGLEKNEKYLSKIYGFMHWLPDGFVNDKKSKGQ